VLSPLNASWRWLYLLALPFLLVSQFLRRHLPESDRYLAVERRTTTATSPTVLLRPPFIGPLLLVCVTVMLCNLTTEATIFSIDFLETQRHLSASEANLLLVAAGAIALPVLTLSGRLSDRVGRRRVCVAGLLIMSAGLLVFFIVARGGLQLGLALGLVYLGLFSAWTTGTAFAVEMFPTPLRGAASAAAAMAKLLGQSASFAIAAALLTITRRPEVTISVLVIGPIVGAFLIARFFPETSNRELEDAVPTTVGA
jgi:MFS family permease